MLKEGKHKRQRLNILISGANEGIGYYLVENLLKQGHKVFVLDYKTDYLELLSTTYDLDQFTYCQCDISSKLHVKACVKIAIDYLKSIDYLIHNACKCTFDTFEDTSIRTFESIFSVNFYGAIHLIKHTLPIFKRQNKGNVFISSSGVGVTGFKSISPYAASKGALESLIKCLNIELKQSNIVFHIIHPPLTKTNASKGLKIPLDMMAHPESVGKGLAKRIHHKRRIITYNIKNRVTVFFMYMFPVSIGRFMSKMTDRYQRLQEKK